MPLDIEASKQNTAPEALTHFSSTWSDSQKLQHMRRLINSENYDPRDFDLLIVNTFGSGLLPYRWGAAGLAPEKQIAFYFVANDAEYEEYSYDDVMQMPRSSLLIPKITTHIDLAARFVGWVYPTKFARIWFDATLALQKSWDNGFHEGDIPSFAKQLVHEMLVVMLLYGKRPPRLPLGTTFGDM